MLRCLWLINRLCPSLNYMAQNPSPVPHMFLAHLGTAEVSSGAEKPFEIERPLLPSVTVIFAAVVDGDALTRQQQGIAQAVHHATGSIMQVNRDARLVLCAAGHRRVYQPTMPHILCIVDITVGVKA